MDRLLSSSIFELRRLKKKTWLRAWKIDLEQEFISLKKRLRALYWWNENLWMNRHGVEVLDDPPRELWEEPGVESLEGCLGIRILSTKSFFCLEWELLFIVSGCILNLEIPINFIWLPWLESLSTHYFGNNNKNNFFYLTCGFRPASQHMGYFVQSI